MKTMHFYGAGEKMFYVYGEDGKVSPNATKWAVSGKKEARHIAKKEGVKPWNF